MNEIENFKVGERMNRMKTLKVLVAFGISLVMLTTPLQYVSAESLSSIKSKQNKLLNEKEDAKNEKAALEKEEKQVAKEMEEIDNKLSATHEKLRQKQSEIKSSKEEIAKLEQEIAELKKRIESRDELIKDRMRSLQTSGGSINYAEVLLGAHSFSDFLRRLSAVSTIVDADKTILEEHKNDKNQLEANEKAVQAKLAKQEKDEADLVSLSNDLEEQNAVKEALLKKITKDKKHLANEIESIEEQQAILAAQEKVLKQQEADRKKAELERQKQLEQQQSSSNNSSGSSSSDSGSSGNSSSSSSGGGSYPPASSGLFQRPANGPVTSEFAARWGSFHYGIDIGKRGSSVPIVAAADGRVISSYYSSSYGNVVFISHNLNGKTYTTVYAHMESRGVSAGQSVSRGQFIGYMGNTGQSFGAHLHFEIHEGAWNGSKSNAVNPRKYISF